MSQQSVFGVPLPSQGHTTRFIAFARTPITTPAPNGRSVPVRAQTAITVYPPMSITAIEEGGRSGNQEGLARVVMDHASAGFQQQVTASIRTEDNPAYQALLDAQKEGRAVVVTTEVRRRRKTKNTSEEISLLTPIQALRGADAPDVFAKASMDASGKNVAVVLAAVDETISSECVSDPAEWGFLAANRYGDMAPAGWAFVGTVQTEDDKWRETAALIPDKNATQPTNAGLSGDQVAALVAEVKKAVVEVLTSASPVAAPAKGGSASRGRDKEPTTYTPRLGDGRVNVGWAGNVQAYWAFKAVADECEAQQVALDVDSTIRATGLLLEVADRVQAGTYGHGFVPDRTARSHELARRTVTDVAAMLDAPMPLEAVRDGDEQRVAAWMEIVAGPATELLTKITRLSTDFLTHSPSPSTAPSAASSASAPRADVDGVLGRVAAAWGDFDALGAVFKDCQNAGIADTTVTVTSTDKGVRIVFAEGGVSLREVITRRGNELRAQAQATTHPKPEPEPHPQPEPAAQSAPAQGVQDEFDVGGPEPTGPMGYPTDLDKIATALTAASSRDELKGVWDQVLAANLADSQVRFDGKTVQSNSTGFAYADLGSVFAALAENLPTAPADAAPETTSAGCGFGSAQEFLDAAQAASTAAEVTSLAQQAAQAGMDQETVTMGGIEGPLWQALKHLASRKEVAA